MTWDIGSPALGITIIASKYPFSGRVPLVPPILEYLAALTLREMPDARISLVDANQQEITPDAVHTTIVAISAMTATITWAYRFADECRKRGIRVILGGIHPTALPEEAALHADIVVIGEAESVWGQVLRDIRAGCSNKFYRGERLPLANLPRPIDGKLKGNYQFRAFFTMRGCPYRCSFCSVRRFFGDTIRYRPVGEVVNEIEACAGKVWFNGDDNIWGGDVRRSIELFSELAKGTQRKWYGFGDLRSVQSAEGKRMLKAARASGLFSVWVGWESDEEHLPAFNAAGKQGADRIAAVKMMQDAGIDVTLFVVLGGRSDSLDSFQRTLELSETLNAGVHPVLLTPLPGTELYQEYQKYLLPGLGWDSFQGVKAVFEHPAAVMSPVRRELEYHHLVQEIFRFRRLVKRTLAIPRAGFPSTHLLSLMMQLPMKVAFSKAYAEWRAHVQMLADMPERAKPALSAPSGIGEVGRPSGRSGPERRARSPVLQRLDRHMPKLYGLFFVLIALIHVLHEQGADRTATLDGSAHALDQAEEIAFWSLLLVGAAVLIIRQIKIVKWYRTVTRIARDRFNQWATVVREAAYAALLGAGAYWSYLLVADLI